MVSNTTDLCKPMLQLYKGVKTNLTLGFFILSKSLEIKIGNKDLEINIIIL